MSTKDVRLLAQTMADEAIEAQEFISASEVAEDLGLDLTEDELDLAFKLSVMAKAVLPDE